MDQVWIQEFFVRGGGGGVKWQKTIILQGSRGGGGGGPTLFMGGGGGPIFSRGGVQLQIPMETYRACDFPVPPPPLHLCMWTAGFTLFARERL